MSGRWLLDVNALVGLLWSVHSLHGRAAALGRRYRFLERLPSSAVLRGQAVRSHKDVGDLYLCNLAVSHRARLATLDEGIKHPAAVVIA